MCVCVCACVCVCVYVCVRLKYKCALSSLHKIDNSQQQIQSTFQVSFPSRTLYKRITDHHQKVCFPSYFIHT